MTSPIDSLRVFTASRVHTMDLGRPAATAVAVANGAIVLVGTLESIQPWLRRHDHVVDDRYADRVLLPGFIDPHTHFRTSGTFAGLHYVGPIESGSPGSLPAVVTRDDVLARLAELVASTTRGDDGQYEPILCWGYDPASQAGHLDRDMLDQVSDTVPIWVCAYAPHIVYTNTPMQTLTGVDDSSDFHGLGRYPDGRLNGWFIETGAIAVATRPVSRRIYREGFGRAALARMGTIARGAGVTTSADMGWGFENFEREWDDHRASIDAGELPVHRRERAALNDERLAVHGVKFINDGSYPSMTLQLGWPGYLDGEQGLTGETAWADVYKRMLPYWEAGVQIHSHANGDATVDMTLDVLAASRKRGRDSITGS